MFSLFLFFLLFFFFYFPLFSKTEQQTETEIRKRTVFIWNKLRPNFGEIC